MRVLTVGGVSLVHLVGCPATLTDIDANNSGRNAAGTMIRVRIASKKTTFSLDIQNITQEYLSEIIAAVEPVSFDVTYINQSGATVTSAFYCSGYNIEDFAPGRFNIKLEIVQN